MYYSVNIIEQQKIDGFKKIANSQKINTLLDTYKKHFKINPDDFIVQKYIDVLERRKAELQGISQKSKKDLNSHLSTIKPNITNTQYQESLIKNKEELKKYASSKLYGFIHKRFNSLNKMPTPRMYLGPSLDLSRGYIFGNPNNNYSKNIQKKWNNNKIPHNTVFWNNSTWEEEKKALFNAGFPKISVNEMKSISTIGYQARRDVESKRNDLFGVVRHFPGGDDSLLQTHINKVHFNKGNNYVKGSLEVFQKIISSESPPKGIMLSLATYDSDFFPGINSIIARDKHKYPHLLDKNFKDIPAGFNPFLISYLREKLNFKGKVLPDWLGGMHGTDTFLKSVELNFTSDLVIKKIFMTIMAGNNFISGFSPTQAISIIDSKDFDILKKQYPNLFDLFITKLSDCITPFMSEHTNIKELKNNFRLYLSILMVEKNRTIYLRKHKSGMITFSGKKQKGFKKVKMNIALLSLYKIRENKTHRSFFDNVMKIGLAQNDVWNRTGVEALVYRVAIVKKIYKDINGKELPISSTPIKSNLEDEWMDKIMLNIDFKRIYSSINWEELYLN